jgi:hypothetical protein
MRHKQRRCGRNRKVTKGTSLLKTIQLLVLISPRIAAGWLKHRTSTPSTCDTTSVWSKSSRNKGNFTLQVKIVFRPISLHIAAGWLKHYTWHTLAKTHIQRKFGRNRSVTKTTYSWGRNISSSLSCLVFQARDSNMTCITPYTCAETVQVWSKSHSKTGHFTPDVSRCYLAAHCMEWSKHCTWHSLHKLHSQCKFGWDRELTKGTLILRPKEFLVHISPRIAAVWRNHQTWYSFHMRHNQCKFNQNRAVIKGTSLLPPIQFVVPVSPRKQVPSRNGQDRQTAIQHTYEFITTWLTT